MSKYGFGPPKKGFGGPFGFLFNQGEQPQHTHPTLPHPTPPLSTPPYPTPITHASIWFPVREPLGSVPHPYGFPYSTPPYPTHPTPPHPPPVLRLACASSERALCHCLASSRHPAKAPKWYTEGWSSPYPPRKPQRPGYGPSTGCLHPKIGEKTQKSPGVTGNPKIGEKTQKLQRFGAGFLEAPPPAPPPSACGQPLEDDHGPPPGAGVPGRSG